MARSRKILTASALGIAALALIAASTGVTGAYFSDSHNGAINAATGGVKVTITSSPSDLALNFSDLLPGTFQTQQVTYVAAGTAGEDIWLVLPTNGTADRFNGTAGTVPGGDLALGRYGHFAVDSPASSFTSFNLATAGTGTHAGATCAVDPVTGDGGSNRQAADTNDFFDFCPVPSAILLSSNLTSGHSGFANITFGYTKLLKGDSAQNAPLAQVAQFKIVATQHGILPNDPNNVVR